MIKVLFTELNKIDRPEIWKRLEQSLRERGIDPAVLKQAIGEGVAVEDLLASVLEELIDDAAEANRESFRARQRKGMADAQSKGVPIGRPSQKDAAMFAAVKAMYEDRQITGQEAANRLGVARGTFYRWLKEDAEQSKETD